MTMPIKLRTILASIALLLGLAATEARADLTPTTTSLTGTCTSGTSTPSAAFAYAVGQSFNLTVTGSTAVGSVTVTKSADNGATFSAIIAGSNTASALTPVGSFNVYQDSASTQFRVECAITASSITWLLTPDRGIRGSVNGGGGAYAQFLAGTTSSTVNLPVAYYSRMRNSVTYSAAQQQQLYQSKFTPLADTDITALSTVYTTAQFTRTNQDGSHTQDTAYVTLTPSNGASWARSVGYYLGEQRMLRVSAATVTSMVDGAGNAVSSAVGWTGKSKATFNAGAAVAVSNVLTTAASPTGPVSFCSGCAFNDTANLSGIIVFPTMLEAVDAGWVTSTNSDGANPGTYPSLTPNLAALGL